MAEFIRIGGSGRPEDAVCTPHIRLQLIASVKARLAAKRAKRPRPATSPAVDIKRLQANDLD
ncbi:hypothetical protein [Cupriavidus oxalaticus]|uniref:Uncharacterized protein n=1 Tax=Cupriavidus oxalaticus TaxID=96344 RepID=A0A4P7LR51_9BURK|nr:hypothetical protein [Cupriavidus oxalaticus]QBY56133.1 hypothetical protein E0W60_34305 [Cupriavidus oxalaticus]